MPKVKLTIPDLRAIFYFKELGYSGDKIGSLFGISKSHVSRIVNFERWGKKKNQIFSREFGQTDTKKPEEIRGEVVYEQVQRDA